MPYIFSPRLYQSTRPARFALPCSLLSSLLASCGSGGRDADSGRLPPRGTDDIQIGSGDGDGVPTLPPQFEGGSTDISDEQVDTILGAECTGASQEGERLPATLQLVVDVSGSMNSRPPGADSGPSKWEITRDALQSAVATLPATVAVGALYFPNKTVVSNSAMDPGPASDCVRVSEAFPLAPLGPESSAHREGFARSLDAVEVASYTPTHDAYRFALHEQLVPYAGPNKFILLITDGAPTMEGGCSWPVEPAHIGPAHDGDGAHDGDTQPIVADISEAHEAHGVRTFVIGAPGSERSVESETDKRPWLSEAALVGGTAREGCTLVGPEDCHFDMAQGVDFAGELRSALSTITSHVVNACTFRIPESDVHLVDPSLTQLIVEWGDGTNSLVHGDADEACSEGWKYDGEKHAVELCEATCTRVQTDPRAVVHVSFGCTEEEVDLIVR